MSYLIKISPVRVESFRATRQTDGQTHVHDKANNRF